MKPSSGRIELTLGWQVAGLVAAGVPGMIPLASWFATMLVPLDGAHAFDSSSSLPAVLGGGAAVALVVLPWLVPWLVLRARQPRGAFIEWDDEHVIEWDGPWKRAVVRFRGARAVHLAWTTRGRNVSWVNHAVQLTDAESGATITAWTTEPDGAPVVRRRLCAKELTNLVDAIEHHHLTRTANGDWSLVADPARTRSRVVLVLGRLGYPCAVAAPLLGQTPLVGFALGAAGASLLALRAWPAWRELFIVVTEAKTTEDVGHRTALRLRSRAITIEAVARASFVLLTVASTIVGNVVMR